MTIREALGEMTMEQKEAVLVIARTFYGWGLAKEYVDFGYFEECLKTEAADVMRAHDESIEEGTRS